MKKKVLVLDDDARLRASVRVLVAKLGREVLEAGTVSEALSLLDQADVVLLDLILNGETGEWFLRHMRKVGNYTPVVVMSGLVTESEAEERLKRYKIVAFMKKPFSLQKLEENLLASEKVAKDIRCVEQSADRMLSAAAKIETLAHDI